MNVKPRTRLGKTYDKGSRHNLNNPRTVQVGIRMSRDLKRKIQKFAESNGIDVSESIRRFLEEKYGRVVLTSEDLFQIAKDTQEQEIRNAKKIGLA